MYLGDPENFTCLSFKLCQWHRPKKCKNSIKFSTLYIDREGIDARCEKTGDHVSREPKKIETSATRRFEGNRLNCVVTEPDF